VQKLIQPLASQGSHLSHIYEVTTELTVASHRNASIAVWRKTPSLAGLNRIDGYLADMVTQHPRLVAIVVAESGDLKPPGEEVRREHARLTKKYESYGVGAAMIIDGTDIRHSALRFVLTTIQLISSPSVPQNIFDSVRDAAAWAATLTRDIDAAKLSSAISEARTRRANGVS
jgi:hypothetical protein